MGKSVPVLFDSGAEINVLSKDLLDELNKSGQKIQILKRKGRLRCANNSSMVIIGYVLLEMKIGPNQLMVKFTVVDNIFPKAIIGLKCLKKEKIDILASRDCVTYKGIELPFLSKTVVSEN